MQKNKYLHYQKFQGQGKVFTYGMRVDVKARRMFIYEDVFIWERIARGLNLALIKPYQSHTQHLKK